MPLATLPCQLQSCVLHRYKTAESPGRMKPTAKEKQTLPLFSMLCEREREREGHSERGGGQDIKTGDKERANRNRELNLLAAASEKH